MTYHIDDNCVACGACEPECPAEAITEQIVKYRIDPEKCTGCSSCAQLCPMEAIASA